MSNPTTNYKISTGQDLSGIFQPISLGTAYPTTTGYKISSGADLNTIFAAYTTGAQANATGYKISTGADLNEIFAKYNPLPYTITGGSYTKTSDGTYNYILTFKSNSAIVFTSNVGTINYTVVGGGAGGMYGNYTVGFAQAGGTGGGGGQVIRGNSTFSTGTSYTIKVGTGGDRGIYNNIVAQVIPPTNGDSSIISTITANGGIIKNGGFGGSAGTGTSNGNPGSNGISGTYGYGGDGGGGGGGSSATSGTGIAGGGGAGFSTGGTGGVGGINPNTRGSSGQDGSNNSGGGGGGGGGAGKTFIAGTGTANSSGGAGGSGVIILKFNYT